MACIPTKHKAHLPFVPTKHTAPCSNFSRPRTAARIRPKDHRPGNSPKETSPLGLSLSHDQHGRRRSRRRPQRPYCSLSPRRGPAPRPSGGGDNARMGGTHLAGTDGFCRSLHLGLVSSLLKPLSLSPLPLPPRRLRHPPTATTTPELFIISSPHPRSVSKQIHSLNFFPPYLAGPLPSAQPRAQPQATSYLARH